MTREEAINEICDMANSLQIMYKSKQGQALTMAIESLKNQKTGHWIYTPTRRMVDETDEGFIYETDYKCSCSECNSDFGFRKMSDNYCKNCGAKMGGE